jgi:plastocyanin
VDIVRRNDGAVEFQPSPIRVQSGDTVFWRNLDPDAQHWITRSDGDRTTWFAFPLAPFKAGQPADVTDGVLVDARVSYRCDLHPGEQGEIEIG